VLVSITCDGECNNQHMLCSPTHIILTNTHVTLTNTHVTLTKAYVTLTNTCYSHQHTGGWMSYVVGFNSSHKPVTNTAWIRAKLCKLRKRVSITDVLVSLSYVLVIFNVLMPLSPIFQLYRGDQF
jgi:hypothetical protein